MNALRNIFNTSSRTLSFLRQNGQNALFNLTQQPVDGITTVPPASTSVDTASNADSKIKPKSVLIPKSIVDGITFKGKSFDTIKGPGSLSPTTLKRLRRAHQKVELVYLCQICNTRNTKEVSEAAYRNGIVILQCDGCAISHLICDNLGWFANTKGRNFDEVLAERAGDRRVKVIKINEHGELI